MDDWLAHRKRPSDNRIIIDVDATDDEIYGQQEFAAFHGYYDHCCHLPLLFHDGDPEDLYRKLHCLRADRSENRIKEMNSRQFDGGGR